jgi:hypothetical protein
VPRSAEFTGDDYAVLNEEKTMENLAMLFAIPFLFLLSLGCSAVIGIFIEKPGWGRKTWFFAMGLLSLILCTRLYILNTFSGKVTYERFPLLFAWIELVSCFLGPLVFCTLGVFFLKIHDDGDSRHFGQTFLGAVFGTISAVWLHLSRMSILDSIHGINGIGDYG